MTDHPLKTPQYRNWLTDIKQRIRKAQIKAAVQVNTTLLTFYWELGAQIVECQQSAKWGSGFLPQLIKDPYTFDFLTLTQNYNERELEKALIDHITNFLLELGTGFAFVGRQQELQVGERDEPAIGILLCKFRNPVVVEYALSDIAKPMGVSEYQLTRALPDNLKPSLPSIEEMEAEFGELKR
ncbi:PDDEXK nuclease domain-containing protein [Desulfobacter postgatei]|uniref:YhcG PDDEXK nuclease domain-containing protein n=1 Tax=Desulfobacter postgatei 2ac9 TaxID=879212 RepID=I5AZM0_9BACT|nr:PDDEXK nuclease domain-containing protein [Desulfobacter postgatei]EIM62683.1 hypothetical protein DespoDRAFT_00683 [Desulfobacter postgatei 2ac9]